MKTFYCKKPAHIAFELSNSVCVTKINTSTWKLIGLGFLAGIYIAFGACTYILVSADVKELGIVVSKILGGSAFAVGLILVVIAGAELFTGNNLMLMSVLDKKANLKTMLYKWVIVFVANFLGALFVAYLMYLSGLWKSFDFLTGIQTLKIATAKVNLPFSEAFVRGILCNWLVCLAVWMALASRDITGKILAIFFPIMTFVALGFEHSIANMFFISYALMLKGAGVISMSSINTTGLTWYNMFIGNLIPVIIGNIIGGGFFVAFIYWLIYLKTPTLSDKALEID
ncbi:MAG: formate/nitrite transporter family protein [bacterium]|nr:formate/nitrite transporter family protein [bacterium]